MYSNDFLDMINKSTPYYIDNNSDAWKWQIAVPYKFPKIIDALFLLAAPFEKNGNTLGDFKLSDNLDKLNKQVKKIYILHSEDDLVVPITDSDKYISALPSAELVIFHDKGHFNTEEFSGLVYLIKDL